MLTRMIQLRHVMQPPEKLAVERRYFLLFLLRLISPVTSYPLYWLRVPPNMVTAMSVAAGIAGSVQLIRGELVWGAALMLVWALLDCSDGEVARASGRSSRFGAALETVNSDIQYMLLMPSLALGWRRSGGEEGLWFLALAFWGTMGYMLFRHLLEKRGDPNLSVPLLASQTNLGAAARRASRLGNVLYLLRRNLLSQDGVLLPVILAVALLEWGVGWVVVAHSTASLALFGTYLVAFLAFSGRGREIVEG